MKKGLLYILITIVAAVLASCERRDMTDIPSISPRTHFNEPNFELRLNLNLEIENEESIETPDLMVAAFFDPESKEIRFREYISAQGGMVYVDPGVYHMIVYTFDTYSTHIRQEDFHHTIEAYTNPVQPYESEGFNKVREEARSRDLSRNYLDQTVVYEPDHLFVSAMDNLKVNDNADNNHLQSLDIDGYSIAKTYKLSIGPVEGAEYISEANAYITGQINSLQIGTNTPTGEPSTLYIPMGVDFDNSMLVSTFRTFGRHPDSESEVYLVIDVTDKGGNSHIWEWNVTDQFDDSDSVEIHITDEITIEEPEGEGGGFEPTVDLWDEEEIIIEI